MFQINQKKKIIISRDDVRIEEALQILKKTIEEPIKEIDETDLYCNYLSSKFKKYTQRTRMLLEHDINKLLLDADLGKYEVDTTQHPHYNINSYYPLSAVSGLVIPTNSSQDNSLHTRYTFPQTSPPESTCTSFSTLSGPQVQHFSDNFNPSYTFPQTATPESTSATTPELHYQSTSNM